jgi:hypothetical protein
MGSDAGPADAIRKTASGIAIEVMVTPNASNPGLSGYNPWRKRLEFRVAAEAKRYRANGELRRQVADILGISMKAVSIARGERAHEKTVEVEGVDRADALAVIREALGGDV